MPDLEELLRDLVTIESPSADHAAVRSAQELLADHGSALLGVAPAWIDTPDGPPALLWTLGPDDDPRRVLLLGHVDTVWPAGTLERIPFEVAGDVARGPGVFDMKAGLAVALLTLERLGRDVPVSLLVTGDEETGSAGSRQLIEKVAADAQACLVLEGAGPDGAVKSARKGWSFYTFTCHGTAAHAGLEPEKGVNALLGLADVVRGVDELNAPEDGLTVTPTMARAGTTVNTVPDRGEVVVDVRSTTAAQQEHVDKLLRQLTGRTAYGLEIALDGGVNRPPMQAEAAGALVTRLRELAARHGRPEPVDVAVGGISDANLTAAIGVPTLDGLGAVGGGPHADHEWVDLTPTRDRVSILAELITDLVTHPLRNT